jgi:hypothetical protein
MVQMTESGPRLCIAWLVLVAVFRPRSLAARTSGGAANEDIRSARGGFEVVRAQCKMLHPGIREHDYLSKWVLLWKEDNTMSETIETPPDISVEHDKRKHRYVIKQNGEKQLYVLSHGMRQEGELWVIFDAGYAQILELQGSSRASALARAVAMLKNGETDPAMQSHRVRRQRQRKVSLQMAIEDAATMSNAVEARALTAIFDNELLKRIDEWRAKQLGPLTRKDAVRRLVEQALPKPINLHPQR